MKEIGKNGAKSGLQNDVVPVVGRSGGGSRDALAKLVDKAGEVRHARLHHLRASPLPSQFYKFYFSILSLVSLPLETQAATLHFFLNLGKTRQI